MGQERREDDAHDIGDSKPGDIGDSKGTLHDRGDAPMARIHNRRDGELLSKAESKKFLSDNSDAGDKPGHHSDEERKEGYCSGSRDPEEVGEDSAKEWESKFDKRHLPNGERFEEGD